MVNYAQGWQNLHAAVNILAGASTQKQNAIIYNMAKINPDHDLPPEIRRDFTAFMREMHSHRTRDSEGAVWDVIMGMDRQQRQQAIARIISFYDVVSRTIGAGENPEQEQPKVSAVPQDFAG